MQNERFRKQNRKLGGTRFERDRDAFLLQKALRERNFQRFETILGKNGTGRVPVLLRYHYASLLQQHGRAERAMQIFRGIARGKKSVEPRLYAGACYHLFELYRDAGRNRNALVALKRCLESAPDHRKASHAWRESGAGAFPGKKTA
jgi:tetratricopeptide (TPR) repeat protein